MITAIIACAGKGVRAGFNKNKLLVPFNGKTVLEMTLSNFLINKQIDKIIITSSKEDLDTIKNIVKDNAQVVLGGETRTQSIKNALATIEDGIVLIHDGARPFVSQEIINNCIASVKKYGSAITALPSADTICQVEDENIINYLGKDKLYKVQTPQAFNVKEIKNAYEKIDKSFNDDGEVYKNVYKAPHIVMGDKENIKLTYPQDFDELNKKGNYRFGVGFDCHRLVENRKLILGGIEIPHTKGLLGHSDADVLTHAIMDAILSSLSLRDIGYHFPDTDEKYRDANSMKLLEEVLNIIKEKGYKVESISATIMADKPKLLKHIPTITENLAKTLNIPVEKVGIGATTLEGLGFVGREEGICVHATAVTTNI